MSPQQEPNRPTRQQPESPPSVEPDTSGLPEREAAQVVQPSPPAPARIPRTRIGMAWLGICAAVVILIVLIVFMLQNTATVEVAFLGLDGRLPLAIALLIALVSGILLTLIIGTARIGQLRRLARKRRQQETPTSA
jgi:putative membrane protein